MATHVNSIRNKDLTAFRPHRHVKMEVRRPAAHLKSDSTKFEVKSTELVYEKLIDDFVRPWYQGKSPGFTAQIYDKAMKELDQLKKKMKKKTNGGKMETPEGEKKEVKMLPDSLRKGSPNKGECKGKAVREESGGRGRPISKSAEQNDLERALDDTIYRISIKDGQINDMNKKISKLLDQLNEAKKEIDSLRMRLSQAIGEKMRDNNPEIADLSDPFRPTELGTYFSELYDNEWSDAYEKLPGKDEKAKVMILYYVIKSAFEFCDRRKDDQLSVVASTLHEAEDDEEVSISSLKTLLKSTRKAIAPNVSKRIAKVFTRGSKLKTYLEGLKIKEMDKTLEQYAMRCAELCWHMVVSDPPLVISVEDTGNDFRSNVYRPYTRSDKGKSKVEYVVWPALYLHDGGPLVSRGVAQPDTK